MSDLFFISYSSSDKSTAMTICRLLEDKGFPCWIAPRNVPPGSKYGETIAHAIDKSPGFILILSENSNASEQVMNEVERAVTGKKPLFPVRISPVTPSPELSYFISRHQWLDAFNSPLETIVDQLSSALRLSVSVGIAASETTHQTLEQTRDSAPIRQEQEKSFQKIIWSKRSALAGIVLLLVALAIFLTLSKRQPWVRTSFVNSDLSLAYKSIEEGDWSKAELLFNQLEGRKDKKTQSQGYTGLAAVALAKGDHQQALALVEKAESLDSEISYSFVIRGDIYLAQGKMEEAASAYETATRKHSNFSWQLATTYSRLGRIYAVQGHSQKALEYYDRAISQRSDLATVYANRGHLLETLGKSGEALDSYSRALELNPSDRLTEALFHEAQRKEKLSRDKAKQERIDQLVAELIRVNRESTPKERPTDAWTSTPLTLAFLNVQSGGIASLRAGEDELLLQRLTEGFQSTGRIQIIDRSLLDRLLEELKLSASDLTDPQMALRVGKILAARLIASVSFNRWDKGGQISVRIIETETTRVKASAVGQVDRPERIDIASENLVKNLFLKLIETYPLQGRIAQITSNEVLLNIGAEQGLTSGIVMQVFGSENPVILEGKILGHRQTVAGLVELTSVEANLSQAKILRQDEPFQTGWKVKEIQNK